MVQHAYLRPEFDRLAKVANVIYYDQRGCGKSGKAARYLWQDHVSDLKRVIQHDFIAHPPQVGSSAPPERAAKP